MADKERNPVKDEPRNRDVARTGRSDIGRRGSYDPFALSPGEFFANPFSVMRRMHDEMDRVFGEAFGNRFNPAAAGGGLTSWSPAVEVSERENEFTVCAELPGLKPEEVKVEITDDALVIEGERKQEHEEKEGGRYRSERRYGRFHRTIPLPEGVSADQAKADFRNGELRVTVPVQRPEHRRRQIPIGGQPEHK